MTHKFRPWMTEDSRVKKVLEDTTLKYTVNFLKLEPVAKSFAESFWRNGTVNASYIGVSNEDKQTIGDTHHI